MTAALVHSVRSFEAQRDGMAVVSGWQVWAQVTYSSGRQAPAVSVAICPDRDTADEIAELLNAKYAGEK